MLNPALFWAAALFGTLARAADAAAATDATASNLAIFGFGGEASHVRNFFMIGGEYTSDGNGGHIFHNQMYVEHLTPSLGVWQPYPLVFIHGQAQDGTNWLNKPDGTVGWASRFLQEGFELYIVDQTLRGRSAWQPAAGAALPTTYSAEIIQQRFTAPENYLIWPQAANHTQWPGNGTMGDPIFDRFYSSNVQFINNATYQQRTVQAAGAALLDRIGKPVILVGHSQGGLMPIIIADARPALTKALILLEPTGPPFQEQVFSNTSSRPWGLADIPLTYSPAVTDPATDLVKQTLPSPGPGLGPCILQADSPAPRKLVNLASKPVLFLTTEASYHAVYDYCTVKYLIQAGVTQTKHLELGKIGIHGNGHMVFMEKNSDLVQSLVWQWIEGLH